jgi:hypothetical protein
MTRRTVSALHDLHARDGWAPLCRALRLPVPDEPFPHANTRADWARGASATERNEDT